MPMPVTVDEFKNHFPEFDECPDAFLQSYLDDAEQSINRVVWDADTDKPKGDVGQKYLAAHMIAMSPFGQQARLIAEGALTSTYEEHYERVLSQVVMGAMVI